MAEYSGCKVLSAISPVLSTDQKSGNMNSNNTTNRTGCTGTPRAKLPGQCLQWPTVTDGLYGAELPAWQLWVQSTCLSTPSPWFL